MSRKILLLLLLLPFLCSESLGQSRIFWADAGQHRIRSVYLDGSNVATVTQTRGSTGMTVDTKHGWIYYVTVRIGHGLYGELRRIPLTGGADEMVVDTRSTDCGLAIDYVDDRIYWATREGDEYHISIMRSHLDGTQVEEVAHSVSEGCHGLAVDPVGRHVYWTTGTTILRLHVDTWAVEDVGPSPYVDPYPAFDGGISIDVPARKMYWTRKGNRSSSGFMKILRADLDGSNIELVWEDTYADAGDIVVDGVNKYVYWTHWSAFLKPDGVLIHRARIDQPITWENIQDLAAPPETPDDLTTGLALFVDPGPPVLENPEAEAPDVATTTELKWQAVECSARYDVQVAADPQFASMVYRDNLPGLVVSFVAPVAQHRYWWRVHSNACGIASHWSTPRWFDVGAVGPLAPNLLAPETGAETGTNVTFSWTPGPSAMFHTFQLSTESNFATTLVNRDSLTQATFDVDGLVPGQAYYWRVSGVDDQGQYTFSRSRLFAVAESVGAVTLVEPADAETGVAAYTSFSWQAVDGAESYRFQLSEEADFSTILVEKMLTETGFQMDTPLAYSKQYFWRVCGLNLAGDGPWADRVFTIAVGTANESRSEIPSVTRLHAVYPNPASTLVNLAVDVARTQRVRLTVFDVYGRQLATLFDAPVAAGRYTEAIPLNRWASGTYFAVLETGDVHEERVFVIVR